MNSEELQALAVLTGGRMFENRLYLPIKTADRPSQTCKLCAFEHRGGSACGRFYSVPPVMTPWPCANGPGQLTVWQEYKP